MTLKRARGRRSRRGFTERPPGLWYRDFERERKVRAPAAIGRHADRKRPENPLNERQQRALALLSNEPIRLCQVREALSDINTNSVPSLLYALQQRGLALHVADGWIKAPTDG